MKDTAKDLLEDYLYVYNIIMSAPCEICKFAFHQEQINDEFCKKNCCYPTLDDFNKICKHLKISTKKVVWFCCNDQYIKGVDYKKATYLHRGQQINIRKQREQINKYFWLYAYIKAPKEHNEFFSFMNDLPTLENSKFNYLVEEFSSITKLLGYYYKPSEIYNQISDQEASTPSFQWVKDRLLKIL